MPGQFAAGWRPIKALARMMRRHWPNIQTFFAHRITNAGAESMNSKIQKIKILARGFRNRTRFRQAIYFHLWKARSLPGPLHAALMNLPIRFSEDPLYNAPLAPPSRDPITAFARPWESAA